MGAHLQRAQVLLEQSRHDLAADELRQELAADPDNPLAHSLLALCLAKHEDFRRATEEAEAAVHLAPDMPFAHYALGSVLHDRNYFAEAENAVVEAIRLDPESADFYALLAGIRYDRRNWPSALDAAETGLRLDPEHVGCNNLRAMALIKLGRQTEASDTLKTALAREPEDAITHANLGWALLEKSETAKAMEHFREALRLDPNLEWARVGIVEALKARNFIYRWLLRYFLWMQKLSFKAQWAVILGGYFGYRILLQQKDAHPALGPYVLPIQVFYLVFAWLTWTAEPLFNLLLRVNRFGRLALSREQIVASNWVGGFVALALASFGTWLATGNFVAALGAAYSAAMVIPIAASFKAHEGWPRVCLTIYTILLGVTALSAVLLLVRDSILFVLPAYAFLGGFFVFQFVANGLQMYQPRR